MGVHTKLSGNSRPAKKCKKVKGFSSQDALFSGQNDITCLKMFNTLGIILNRTMILSANTVKINVFFPKWQIGIPQRAAEFISVSKGLKDHVILWSSLAGKQCRRSCIHIKCIYYRPQTKLRKGNVFISVCLGFCPQGGGGGAVSHHALGGVCGRPPGQTPSRRHLQWTVRILLECILV